MGEGRARFGEAQSRCWKWVKGYWAAAHVARCMAAASRNGAGLFARVSARMVPWWDRRGRVKPPAGPRRLAPTGPARGVDCRMRYARRLLIVLASLALGIPATRLPGQTREAVRKPVSF